MFPRAARMIVGLLVAIIATISIIAFVRVRAAEKMAKHARVKSDIQVFGTQLKAYQSMNGSLPTTERGLQALVEKELLGLIPQDPWNTSYIYRCPGKKHPDGYDLFSAGPDLKPDTADDDWGE